MPQSRRTDAAERDLQDIAYHIASNNQRPSTADSIIDQLIEQCSQLAELSPHATLGTDAPEIGLDVRLWPFKRWVILFRYQPHGVDILRFADSRQDYLAWRLE